MAEPLVPPQPNPEALKPQSVIVGETAIYLSTPQQISGKEVSYITILGAEKRANDGVGSTIPLVKEISRKKGDEGKMVDKPLTNLNDFDEVSWDKISGVQWTDEQGAPHVITKDALSLEPPQAVSETKAVQPEVPAEASSASPVESVAPSIEQPVSEPITEIPTPTKGAREILETLTEDPNIITIVGLKAYETRALDLADRKMQKLTNARAQERADANRGVWEKAKDAVHGLHELVFTTIWKQSIGGIYFQEKARQYYMDMLQTAETPFAEDAIRLSERRATDTYNAKLADSNFVVRAGTRAMDWLKDKVGMRTSIQQMALQEMSVMKLSGEIKGMETFEKESKAIRARFGADFDQADQFVRKQLGEKLEILDAASSEHAPLVEGIHTLLREYASGDIPDKTEFDRRTKEFFNATLKNVRPDIFAEAELYSSSLFDAAEVLRTKMSHEGGMENINEALAGMEIRLGLGAMGEVTSLEPTAVEKGIGQIREIADWLNKKNILIPMVFNEATIGSAVAIVLSGTKFISTMPARAIAGIGGGALAGGLFAGWREYGQLQKDYMTHLRERESGATFTETQKRRTWFERFSPQQRSASDMIGVIQTSLYEGDALKANLTDDELRASFATIADLHARKAVSETGPKRIGLIQYSSRESIESERSALDVTANRALNDIESYLTGHAEQAASVVGPNTFPEFMEKLTVTQTQVLREGVNVIASQDDPIHATLNLVSSYAPEAAIIKRRWPFASKILGDQEKAMGLDAILKEFNTEARMEAVKYGVKAGVVGAAVGVAFQGIAQIGHTDTVTHGAAEFTDAAHANSSTHIELSDPASGHIATIHQVPYQVPKELIITPQTDATGNIFYDAKLDASALSNLRGQEDVILGSHMTETQLRSTLEKAGMSIIEPHKGGEVISSVHDVVKIPDLLSPAGKPIEAQIPPGFGLTHVGDHWQLLDANKQVITTIEFTNTGEIKGGADAFNKLHQELLAHGFEMKTPNLTNVEIPVAAGTPEISVLNGSMMEIQGKDLQEGGLWDYFLARTNGENQVSSANGVKNLFRLYEQHYVPHAADGTPQNISFGDNGSNPYDHVARLRDATFGSTPVKELDIARIANDATINVPKELFGPEAIQQFSELNDVAIAHYQQLIATGKNPMEVLQLLEKGSDQDKIDALLLRLSYFGRDSDMPSKAELSPLLDKLGLTETMTTPAVPATPESVSPIHQFTLTQVYKNDVPGNILASAPLDIPTHIETIIDKATPAPELPWIPIFIPYREVLEAAPAFAEASAGKPIAESFLSPFGYEETLLNRETLGNRKSPRLIENPQAKLNQREEIDWYLNGLPQDEQELLASLNAQDNPVVNPDLRAVVTIPLIQNKGTLYKRLETYMGQTGPDGSPSNPKQIEFVVYEAQIAPPEGSVNEALPGTTKTEIERFRVDHPDTQIVYLTHPYTEQPTAGAIKRDMTNFVLSRLQTLPEGSPEVAVITDNGTGEPIASTYISSVIETLDTNPNLDILAGAYELPHQAYQEFPLLFAQHRAFEVFDALVRHGEGNGVPGIYSGNLAIRAGTLAGVGGYNRQAPIVEDREMTWMVNQARGNADTTATLQTLTATIDPKETVFTHLQQLGLAEPTVPLANNEVYKDMSWQDMAKKASETYTKEQLEAHLTNMHEHMYPTLKAANPERFDAYFKRTMDSLGLTYELKDGNVVISDMTNLNANMAATPDIERFAKDASREVIAETPMPPESPREHLEQLAGPASAEAPMVLPATETLPSSISSPEVTEAPPVEQPAPPAPERLPAGAEDRMNYVLGRTKESEAAVQFTPGELMDYIKNTVDIAGTRITGGRINLSNNQVTLEDMKANIKMAGVHLGDAQFSGTLIADPARGLVVDKNTLVLKLPMLVRPAEGTIRHEIEDFNGLVLNHINGRIDRNWKAGRLDVTGDKLEIKFAKKTA